MNIHDMNIIKMQEKIQVIMLVYPSAGCKVLFIDISSIASFKPFLIAWLRQYCTFSDSPMIKLKSSPCSKYTQLGTIFQEKSCSIIKLFSSSNRFFLRLFLKKNRGHHARLREKENLFCYRA